MLIFQTHAAVPEHVVRQIGLEIKEIVVRNLIDDFQLADKDKDIYRFTKVMDRAINAYAKAEKKSCEGYELDKKSAHTIAQFLRKGQKINAIKEFRFQTGTELKEAHKLINSFAASEVGAVEFLVTFT